MTAGGPTVEVLGTEECHRLLREGGVGRVAFPGKESPVLRPVNFLLVEPRLIIRTGEGMILEAGRRGLPASFEIDGVDPLEHTGWSVVVVGKIAIHPREDALGALPLRAWASGQKSRHVMISLDAISGLQIPSGKGNR